MNDNPALEAFLDFNHTKPKRKESCFQDAFTSSERSENQRILHSFKQLRTQLKGVQRENQQLKQQLKISEIKLNQAQQQLDVVLQSNLTIKAQLKKQSQNHEQLKQKLAQLKEVLSKTKSLEDELQFTKQTLLETKLAEQSHVSEKAKIMEISLNEKLRLQEEILKLEVKTKSDETYLRQIQSQLTQYKSLNIKLENQLRKFSISHEEQTFNNKWTRQNFQTQHLLQKIEDLEKQLNAAKSKIKKEKEKRSVLEQKLLEFQQLSGVNQVKAEAFESEAELLMNRQAKFVKKIASLTKKLENKNQEMLAISTKLANLTAISEDFVSRVKEENASNILECVFEFQQKLKNLTGSSSTSTLYGTKQSRTTQQHLKEFSQNYYSEKINSNYLNHLELQPKQQPIENKPFASRYSFGLQHQKENEMEQYAGIQNKIRKERDEMQRRIKQKYFQKKIDASMPSQAHKLRSEYITTFIHRR